MKKTQRNSRPSIRSLDSLFSKAVRIRDNWTCQRCGKSYPNGGPGLQCSHFIGRAHRNTRWDFENCDTFCNGCHQYFETHKATLYRAWKHQQLAEGFMDLVARGVVSKKWKPWELRELQAELKKRINGS